jgi:hypothetical protein
MGQACTTQAGDDGKETIQLLNRNLASNPFGGD